MSRFVILLIFLTHCNLISTRQPDARGVAEDLKQEITIAVSSGNSTILIDTLNEQLSTGNSQQISQTLADLFIITKWYSVEFDEYAELISSALTNNGTIQNVVVDAINIVINDHDCDAMYALLVASLLSAEDQGQRQPFVDMVIKQGFDKCYMTDFLTAADDRPTHISSNLTTINQTMIDSLFVPNQAADAAQQLSIAINTNDDILINQVLDQLVPAFQSQSFQASAVVITQLISQGAKPIVLRAMQQMMLTTQINITVGVLLQTARQNTFYAAQVAEIITHSYQNGNRQSQNDIVNIVEFFITELLDQVPKNQAGVVIADLSHQNDFQDAVVNGLLSMKNDFNSGWVWSTIPVALLRHVNSTSDVLVSVIQRAVDNSTIATYEQTVQYIINNIYNQANEQQLGTVISKFAGINFYKPVYRQLNNNHDKVQQAYAVAMLLSPRNVSELISAAIEDGQVRPSFQNAIATHLGECVNTSQSSVVLSTLSERGHYQTVAGALKQAGQNQSRLRIAYILKDAIKYKPIAVARSIQVCIGDGSDPVIMAVVSDSLIAIIEDNPETAGDVIAVIVSNDQQPQLQICALALIQAVYEGLSDKASTSITEILRDRQVTLQNETTTGVAKIGTYILSQTRSPAVIDMYTTAVIGASQRGGHYVKSTAVVISELLTHEYGVILLESIPRAVVGLDSQCTTVIESMSRAISYVDVTSRPVMVYTPPPKTNITQVACDSGMLECFDNTCCRREYNEVGQTCDAYSRTWTFVGTCQDAPNKIALQPEFGYQCFCTLQE
eukprot:TRINITY_DN3272_c1_g1_i1.p1 TRINITY_DN3272_c1_g1~~TRINITY_DN3272_c1_g1_i1.p1  ORF type:complete len:826 (-),score=33.44 TRINITY_DN3272_c1_g1_i1:294-2648(-)